jgi:hypothetical protein
MSDFNLPSLSGSSLPGQTEAEIVARVAETIGDVVVYLGLRDQLRARVAEIAAEYAALASSEENVLRDRAIQGAIVEIAMKALIDKGAYDQAVEIFREYMNGAPNFVAEVTRMIIKRMELSPLTIVTRS